MISVVTNLGAKADLNVIDDLGVYQAVDCVNGPTGVTGYVFLHVTSANVGGNSRAVQKLWNLSSGTEYTRVKTIGGWTPWEAAGTGGGGGDYDPLGTADAVMADHLAQADPHPQYHNDARGDARYDALGAASTAVSTHVAAVDPHTQYLTNARGDARYDAINAASDAVTAHVGAVDPHTQYLTNTRGDARYDAIGTADAAITAHEAEADPHTQYAKKAGAVFTGAISVNGNTVWHAGNDGIGSGLDADLLDGLDSSAFGQIQSGVFTPRLMFGGADVGVIYAEQTGSYYCVGKLCFIVARMALTSKGTSTGPASVENLPFTAVTPPAGGDARPGQGAFGTGAFSASVTVPVTYHMFKNTTSLILTKFVGPGYGQLSDADFSDNTALNITFMYWIA